VSGREWRRVVGIAYRRLDKQSSTADDPLSLFLIAFRTESTPSHTRVIRSLPPQSPAYDVPTVLSRCDVRYDVVVVSKQRLAYDPRVNGRSNWPAFVDGSPEKASCKRGHFTTGGREKEREREREREMGERPCVTEKYAFWYGIGRALCLILI